MLGRSIRTTPSAVLRAVGPVALIVVASGCASPPREPREPVPPPSGEAGRTEAAETVRTASGGADAAVTEATPEWLRGLALVGPPGSLRDRDSGALPSFWRGAPVELVIDLASGVRDGSLEILWLDGEGRTVAERTIRLREALTGRGPTVRIPLPEAVAAEPGSYRVEVRWVPKQPRILPSGELAFGIGEGIPATVTPGPPTFPWPPPRPATRHVIDRDRLGAGRSPITLGEAAERLIAALGAAGYAEHAFFAIRPDPGRPPEGFALVTRLEQIFPDGRPRPVDQRWRVELPPRDVFSLQGLIEALFTAPEGHYRVIVFTVTGRPVAPSQEEPTREDAGEWLGRGLARLPPSLAELPWTRGHACTALIYQFRQVGAGTEPEINPPGVPPARIQLERTGVLAALGGA